MIYMWNEVYLPPPLRVELIVAQVLEYDYAPASAMVAGKRIYLNMTQEGRDNIDDLVEAKLIRALRTITADKQPVVAYQARPVRVDIRLNPTRVESACVSTP